MRHKIPTISEVNLELLNPAFYLDEKPTDEDIGVIINVNPYFNDCCVFLFVHIRYFLLEDSKERRLSLFHTDYLCTIEVDEAPWEGLKTVSVKKDFLAHLFGMSFLMIRGAISIRLANSYMGQIEMPRINPLEMLNKVLDSEKDQFILKREFHGGHGESNSDA